jgi:bacteriocin biosynthesis cyclodehydratase domain-containing protein
VLVRDGVPHLRAGVTGMVGAVGPLVLPGRSSCLSCQELVRSAIDPAWPALVTAQDEQVLPAAPSHLVLAVAVAAQAALQVLELVEGGTPGSAGGTLELELPGWRWRRRTWPAHPGCHCGATATDLPASA